MAGKHFGESAPINPLRIFLSILLVVFVSEFAVMLVLPLVLASSRTSWTEAGVDASLLTLILIPFLWLTVIWPLRSVADMRARLLAQLVSLQEEERRRISCDLHDEIGQSLTSVQLGLRALEHAGNELPTRIDNLRKIINDAVHEVRRIANGLRPATLDHLGIASAIERLAEDIGSANGLDVELSIDLPDDRLPISIETASYRIVQEALTNVVRHAEATKVSIELLTRKRWLTLAVRDNGKGLSSSTISAAATSNHFGLVGMKERAALLDGTFSVGNGPEGGTQIIVRLPLPRIPT